MSAVVDEDRVTVKLTGRTRHQSRKIGVGKRIVLVLQVEEVLQRMRFDPVRGNVIEEALDFRDATPFDYAAMGFGKL